MARLPLEGIRVADFTWVWAGPFCTLQLAHLGAEVIRVESMKRVCPTRTLPPWADGQMGINRSGYFNQYNQGKLSLSLDLVQPEAVEIAKRLVAVCDVVAENFAAGVMRRLGLGYEMLRLIKPNVIMISLSGYGQRGPEASYVSYGPAQVPLSGLSSLTGYEGWPPMHVGLSYGDPTGGLHGAFAVLAALYYRQRTGKGQYIDLSQWETSMAVLPEGVLEQSMNGIQPPRVGNRDPRMAPHGVFRCLGEDRWVSIAVGSDDEWRGLCAAMGQPELADDPHFATAADRKANESQLEDAVTAWTEGLDPWEATRILQAAGVPAFPAVNMRELGEDPHLNERDFFVRLEHSEVGVRQHAGIPWKMSGTPCRIRRPAPLLGQHNRYVLNELLGYTREEIEDLQRRQIVF